MLAFRNGVKIRREVRRAASVERMVVCTSALQKRISLSLGYLEGRGRKLADGSFRIQVGVSCPPT